MVEVLNIKRLNELFSSLYGFRSKYKYNLIYKSNKNLDDVYYEIYSINEGYVKITLSYDSYGYGEYITGIEFVEEKDIVHTEYNKV